MAKKEKVSEVVIETIKLSDSSCIKVSSFKFKGEDEVHINVRKFYRTKNDKTWKPARQGMTVPLEVSKKLRVKLKKISELAEEGEGIEIVKKGNKND